MKPSPYCRATVSIAMPQSARFCAHGDGHGVVGFRLRPVARGLRAVEQPIGQNAGAAAGIAVDHQAIGCGEHGSDCLVDRASLEPPIAAAKNDPLQTTVAGHQLQCRGQERPVIGAGLGSIRCIAAMSHSPRLAAARPPVLPTLSALTEIPSDCSRPISTSRPTQWLPMMTRSARCSRPINRGPRPECRRSRSRRAGRS